MPVLLVDGLVPARGGDPTEYEGENSNTARWPIAFCNRGFKTVSMKVDRPWAKTAPNGETCSLITHCHHVAVMARQLMASRVLQASSRSRIRDGPDGAAFGPSRDPRGSSTTSGKL